MRQCSINNSKRTIFRWLLLFLALGTTITAMGQDSIPNSRYDRRVNRMRRYWASLIPTQIVVQNAGNMGLISAGVGWKYGRRSQWETQLLWGYIPRYNCSNAHLTNTIKQNYIPWSISFNDLISLEPLQSSIYLNTVYGHEFWRSQPGRYPDKYYEALYEVPAQRGCRTATYVQLQSREGLFQARQAVLRNRVMRPLHPLPLSGDFHFLLGYSGTVTRR